MTPGQYKLALADMRAWPIVDVVLRSGYVFGDVRCGDHENATMCVTLNTQHGRAVVLVDEIAAISHPKGTE